VEIVLVLWAVLGIFESFCLISFRFLWSSSSFPKSKLLRAFINLLIRSIFSFSKIASLLSFWVLKWEELLPPLRRYVVCYFGTGMLYPLNVATSPLALLMRVITRKGLLVGWLSIFFWICFFFCVFSQSGKVAYFSPLFVYSLLCLTLESLKNLTILGWETYRV
jgi:hypothetical protein